MSDKNPDLIAVSATLNDLARQIHDKKLETTDPKAYHALNDELIEINHRITTVGGQIFTKRSDSIADAAKGVKDSKAKVEKAIDEIEKVEKFLGTAQAFLGLVDNVVALSRKLALA